MEKITINSVMNFITESMYRKLSIEILNSHTIRILIDGEKPKNIWISCYNDKIIVSFSYGKTEITITDKEVLQYKTLLEDVKEYVSNKVVEDFYNIFSKEENRPTDINDLDNEDD